MKSILFVCTGNTCRSVMAEGLFRKMTVGRAGEFSVSSAGISAIEGFGPSPETVQVMKEFGADVAGHKCRRLTRQMIQEADRIFAMEKVHQDLILSLAPEAAPKVSLLTDFAPEALRGSSVEVLDPIRMPGDFYRRTFLLIRDCVENIVKDLK